MGARRDTLTDEWLERYGTMPDFALPDTTKALLHSKVAELFTFICNEAGAVRGRSVAAVEEVTDQLNMLLRDTEDWQACDRFDWFARADDPTWNSGMGFKTAIEEWKREPRVKADTSR
jgi:hypothetical protein